MKFIPGYEGRYSITESGEVYSHDFQNSGKLKKKTSRVIYTGYVYVDLSSKCGQKSQRLHRLVALTYIPNPLNKPHVNHKDGNKQNNHVSNLEWVTRSENMRHAFDVLKMKPGWLGKKGKHHCQSKQIHKICAESGQIIHAYNSVREAAKAIGRSPSYIGERARGEQKQSGKYIWQYKAKDREPEQMIRLTQGEL